MATITLIKFHQSAFIVRAGGQTWAFDFGSEVPDDLVSSIGPVSAVFISHSHPDHLHLAHLRRFSAPTYAPPDVVAILKSQGFEASSIRYGDSLSLGSLSINAFKAD